MNHPKRFAAGLLLLLVASFAPLTAKAGDPVFFSDAVYLGNGVYYSDHFGYYSLDYYAQGYIYKFDFGFLYYLGDDGADGDYYYDFTADDYFYTTYSEYLYDQYAYLYSFNRGTYLYYFEGSQPREFFDFAQHQYIYY